MATDGSTGAQNTHSQSKKSGTGSTAKPAQKPKPAGNLLAGSGRKSGQKKIKTAVVVDTKSGDSLRYQVLQKSSNTVAVFHVAQTYRIEFTLVIPQPSTKS